MRFDNSASGTPATRMAVRTASAQPAPDAPAPWNTTRASFSDDPTRISAVRMPATTTAPVP